MAKNSTAMSAVTETTSIDASYFDNYAGAGTETLTGSSVGLPYLSLIQPSSEAAVGGEVGVWRNSLTGATYGKQIKVIPLAFRTIWVERQSEAPYGTVGRYPVGGIKVELRQPTGGKGYPKMVNPATGNQIQEMFVYVLMLAEHPEDGIMYYTPALSSMKTAKGWNTQLRSQVLPNGVQAPIFAYDWTLVSDMVQNPKQPAQQIAKLISAVKGSIVDKNIFQTYVEPKLQTASQEALQLTSDSTETADVE